MVTVIAVMTCFMAWTGHYIKGSYRPERDSILTLVRMDFGLNSAIKTTTS